MKEKSLGDVSRIDLEMLHSVAIIGMITIGDVIANILRHKLTWKVDDILAHKLVSIVEQINRHLETEEKTMKSSHREGWIHEAIQVSNKDN